MAQECPVEKGGKAPLVFGHAGKIGYYIPHYGFPVRTTLRVKLKLSGNDDYVFDCIVEAGKPLTKASIPIHLICQCQLWNPFDVEPLHVQHFMSNRPIRKVSVGGI